MFSKTDKVYASAKHSVIRDMCVDPDELVFTLAQSLFLFLKKAFLNSPTKIFFKMAAKLSKTTAIQREKTSNPELRPLFRGNDWTRWNRPDLERAMFDMCMISAFVFLSLSFESK